VVFTVLGTANEVEKRDEDSSGLGNRAEEVARRLRLRLKMNVRIEKRDRTSEWIRAAKNSDTRKTRPRSKVPLLVPLTYPPPSLPRPPTSGE